MAWTHSLSIRDPYQHEEVPSSYIFSVFNGFQIVAKVAILLGADVRARPHRLSAHRAPGTTGGDDRRRFRAEVPSLRPRHAAGERGVIFLRAIQIVGDDHDAIFVVVIAQFHPTDPKLLSSFQIELAKNWRGRKHGSRVGQPCKHLFERQSQGVNLLLLHPDDVRLAIDNRQEPETAITGFTDGIDLNPLRVEFSTHSLEPPDYGGKTRPAPDTWKG